MSLTEGQPHLPTVKARLLFVKLGRLGVPRALFRGGFTREAQTIPLGKHHLKMCLSVVLNIEYLSTYLSPMTSLAPHLLIERYHLPPFPALLPVHKIKTLNFLEVLERTFQTFLAHHGGGKGTLKGGQPSWLAFYHNSKPSLDHTSYCFQSLHFPTIAKSKY